MPKVIDCRQTDAQATNKTVTQDKHEVLSRFGRREGIIAIAISGQIRIPILTD